MPQNNENINAFLSDLFSQLKDSHSTEFTTYAHQREVRIEELENINLSLRAKLISQQKDIDKIEVLCQDNVRMAGYIKGLEEILSYERLEFEKQLKEFENDVVTKLEEISALEDIVDELNEQLSVLESVPVCPTKEYTTEDLKSIFADIDLRLHKLEEPEINASFNSFKELLKNIQK